MSGRHPENHSEWREWDNHSWHSFQHPYYDGPEMADGRIAIKPAFSQVLQLSNNKTNNTMKCPPVIASRKIPRSKWEGKAMLVMKISKRKRCQRCKDTTPNCSPLSSSSTEQETPADSGLVSEANRLQDNHQSEGSQTNAANETETTEIWASQVNLGEEDSSETAETNQSSATEKEENNICGATIQLLPTEQRAADEQRNEEDKQQPSNNDDSSREKVPQLHEAKTKMARYETSVTHLEDKKSKQTEQTQSSVPKDPLEQIEKMSEIEQVQVQHPQLLQGKSQMEDICGRDNKWKRRFSMVFSKTSKTEKKTKAEMKTETNMTGEAGEKKSKKWFQRIFSSVTAVIPCVVLCCVVPACRDVS